MRISQWINGNKKYPHFSIWFWLKRGNMEVWSLVLRNLRQIEILSKKWFSSTKVKNHKNMKNSEHYFFVMSMRYLLWKMWEEKYWPTYFISWPQFNHAIKLLFKKPDRKSKVLDNSTISSKILKVHLITIVFYMH